MYIFYTITSKLQKTNLTLWSIYLFILDLQIIFTKNRLLLWVMSIWVTIVDTKICIQDNLFVYITRELHQNIIILGSVCIVHFGGIVLYRDMQLFPPEPWSELDNRAASSGDHSPHWQRPRNTSRTAPRSRLIACLPQVIQVGTPVGFSLIVSVRNSVVSFVNSAQ